jgi:hypothetical protein
MQPAIRTCTDNQRAFGWRKAGGLYLVYDGRTGACGKLPFALAQVTELRLRGRWKIRT